MQFFLHFDPNTCVPKMKFLGLKMKKFLFAGYTLPFKAFLKFRKIDPSRRGKKFIKNQHFFRLYPKLPFFRTLPRRCHLNLDFYENLILYLKYIGPDYSWPLISFWYHYCDHHMINLLLTTTGNLGQTSLFSTSKYNIACHVAHTHRKIEISSSNELYWVLYFISNFLMALHFPLENGGTYLLNTLYTNIYRGINEN